MDRYKINKIGLLNYWLYDEEEFYFCDGKLLLRGSNGSGKSVTMVSFFPLLFDGNKNPERFDTFGSRDRKIEDYVLPIDSDTNESTSYLYMEFYKKSENKYLTIGIGLKAVRNRNVDFWGFAITDNRRVKDGFMLYKDHLRKIPLTKKECQYEIGTGGEFVTSIKEYKSMVNRLLFGFENNSMYSELINLMLQLRSPKLSKDYKPTRLVDILSGVLEPIPDKDIQTISDSIESMNKYKETIDDLTEENKVINLLKNNFHDYSNIILYHKCNDYLKSKRELNEHEEELKILNDKLSELKKIVEESKKILIEYDLELNSLKESENKLADNDLNTLLESQKKLEIQLQEIKTKIIEKENSILNKENELKDTTKNIQKLEDEIYKNNKELNEIKETIECLIEDTGFSDINLNEESINETIENKKIIIKNIKSLAEKKYAEELKVDKLFNEISISENDIKNKNIESNKISRLLIDEANAIVDKYAQMQNNKVLTLTKEDVSKIEEIITNLDINTKNQVETIVNSKYNFILENLLKSKNITENNIRENEYQKEILSKELEDTKNVFDKYVYESEKKNKLESQGIKGKYLYELIDFKTNVDLNTRKLLEDSLRSLGILHTLIFKNKSLSIKTFGNLKQVDNSIIKYFDIIDKEYENETIQVLNSISIDSGETFISENGKYQMGIIQGTSDDNYKLKYIGKNIQEEYLKSLQKNIIEQIEETDTLISKYTKNLENINEDMNILSNEKNINVNYSNYEKYIIELQKINFDIELTRNSILTYHKDIEVISKIIKEIETNIFEKKENYNGDLSVEIIKNAEYSLNELSSKITSMRYCNNNIDVLNDSKNSFQNREESLYNDLEILKDELTENEAKINYYQKEIKINEEEINQDKYKDLKQKLETIKTRISFIEKDKDVKKEKLIRAEKDIEITESTINTKTQSIKDEKIITDCLYDIFKKEYNLGYSSYKNELTDIKSWFKNFKLEKFKAINDANDNFNDRINDYLYKLQNYAGKKIYKFDNLEMEEDYYKDIKDDNSKEKIKNILINAKRTDLGFKYQGLNLNLLELSDTLSIRLEETKNLLNNEDRRLFKDLLLNNVGDTIREKVRSSKIWVEEVKKIMEKMKTSSGLSFSISWVGKGKDAEDEMDTNEVVSIFEGSASSITDEDNEKIVKHFRSKIAQEEEKYDELEKNYVEIIRDVLDYRKWFQFKLFFKRNNGDKRELTDKEFSKFSGGEKAIAMYIPLFAGINAKFNSAKKDAPRIVALDEAFAGVDDINIEDSFRILDELNLDYVLTSQILWGDYSTIKSLSICELHHLSSSDVVSVLRYKWDGHKRLLITDESEYQN